MKDKVQWYIWPLALTAIIAPIFGGQAPNDQLALGQGGLLGGILGDGSLATLPHALIALPVFVVLFGLLIGRKVLQVPAKQLGMVIALFFGLILASIAASSFRVVSFAAAMEWISYGGILYATVAAAGRNQGPRILVGAVFAGCVVIAVQGTLEYTAMKSTDPNWRIFANWVNPNALAAMLVVGVFLGIGLTLTEHRLVRIISGCSTILILDAIRLTGSRGAILVLALGLIVMTVLCLAWSENPLMRRFERTAGILLVVAVFLTTLVLPVFQLLAPLNPHVADVTITSNTGALGRLGATSISTDQSSIFRRLLWKGCLAILEQEPTGVGIGAYQYSSARSGLTTQTQLAHESFLQLGTECTLLSMLLFSTLLCMWAYHASRNLHGSSKERNILRASVVAACFTVLAHSVVDSDFYYFGVGITTFMLIGVSLLLSADAVAPEFLPAAVRRLGLGLVAVACLGFFYCGATELFRSKIRSEIQARNLPDAESDVKTLLSLSPADGEAWNLAARTAGSHEEALSDSGKAVEYAPSQRNFRSLAREQVALGQVGAAISTLDHALQTDPNNMNTLTALLEIERGSNVEEAVKTAKRLVSIEDTPYFRVRSIPEMVPTDTYRARLYLASAERSNSGKIAILKPAVEGYLDYSKRSVPEIVKQASAGQDYAGETLDRAQKNLNDGLEAAHELQRCALAVGDRGTSSFAVDAAKALEAALGSSSK